MTVVLLVEDNIMTGFYQFQYPPNKYKFLYLAEVINNIEVSVIYIYVLLES